MTDQAWFHKSKHKRTKKPIEWPHVDDATQIPRNIRWIHSPMSQSSLKFHEIYRFFSKFWHGLQLETFGS